MCSMFSSACSGILKTDIKKNNRPWYTDLTAKLNTTQSLAGDLKNNSMNSFNIILNKTVSLGITYKNESEIINDLTKTSIKEAQQHFEIILNETGALGKSIKNFESFLNDEQKKFQATQKDLSETIDKIQAEEHNLTDIINLLNKQINDLNIKISTDRTAIGKAKAQESMGIVHTIFGILLVPFTLGVSSILIGIGVSSIKEAESKVASLEKDIKKRLAEISDRQTDLTDDEKQISGLKGINISITQIMNDIENISSVLNDILIQWAVFEDECMTMSDRINNAKSSEDLIMVKAWLNAANNEWEVLKSAAGSLLSMEIADHVECQIISA